MPRLKIDAILSGCSSYILGFGSAVTLLYLENYHVPFGKRLESRHVDSGKVHKDVPTFVFIDEAIPLFVIEPFYDTVCQSTDLLFSIVPLQNVPLPLQTILRHMEDCRSEDFRSGVVSAKLSSRKNF